MRAFLLVLALLAAAACARLSMDPFETPTQTPTPLPTGTPLAPQAGDGHDGPLPVSGSLVVNTCHVVSAAGGNTVTLDDPSGVFPGGMLLLLQVTDDFASSGDPSDVTTPGDAGRWETARVSSVDAAAVATLTSSLTGTYESVGTHRAQACTMPEFTDLTVTTSGTLTARAWNGSTGGVAAFFANGTVNVDGAISADGAGFRGGVRSSGGTQDVTALDTTATNGSGKAEGLDVRGFTLYGRGNYANGGGGGNARQAGGGGGGNGGAGGSGGKQHRGSGDIPNTAGLAGSRVVFIAASRLVLGGGGGAGQDRYGAGTAGAAGGGIVLVFAGQLGGSGTIQSRGASAATTGDGFDEDGAGGGGAGGTVALAAFGVEFTGTVDVRGGTGGDVNAEAGTNRTAGPGGGGAGGHVLAPGIPAAQVVLTGGANGKNLAQVDPMLQSWGATSGGDGHLE